MNQNEDPVPDGDRSISDSLGEDDITTVELPRDFLHCPRAELVALISRMLVFLVEINDPTNVTEDRNHELTRFHSKIPPNISIFNYFARLTKYSTLEHAVLLASVYYIDLLANVYPAFNLNSLTAHRFILTATTVASKGLCDSFCTNSHYAKVGGVHCNELNVLETEFLKKVNYRILPRDLNISYCKLEVQRNCFVLPEIVEFDPKSPLRQKYSCLPNAGYNVLSRYYVKIIQLVGNFNRSPDKTKKVNYVLREDINRNQPNPIVTTAGNTSTTTDNILNVKNQVHNLAGSKRKNYEYENINSQYEPSAFDINGEGEISTPYKKLITEERKAQEKNVLSKSL